MLALKEFRDKAKGFPDLLNYALLPAEGILQGKDGALMASWYFRGPDTDSATPQERAIRAAQLNNLLIRLGSGMMLHCDAIRKPSIGYADSGAFPDPTSRLVDEERRQHYLLEGAHYESEYALTLTYLPPLKAERRLLNLLYEGHDRSVAKDNLADRILGNFQPLLEQFDQHLSQRFVVQRMQAFTETDERGLPVVYDEQLRYYTYCVTGQSRPVRLPAVPMYLDALIGAQPFYGGLQPRIGRRSIRVVAIDGFPADSYPGILAVLDELPMAYRWSTRFIFVDPYQARSLLDGIRRRWQQKQRGFKDQLFQTARGALNLDAVEMTGDAEQAMGEADSNAVRYGFYTSVIVIIRDDAQIADEDAVTIQTALLNRGFSARIEDVNAVEAYLGSLPGHGVPNIRRPMLHSLNLADLLPTTSVWAGLEHNPCAFYPPQSPPLAYAATSGATPFRLNLHIGTAGHTALLGPTDAGKSTLLNFLTLQFWRYPDAQLFGFDYKRSSYVACKACGGDFYDIGRDAQWSFAPLQMIDTPQEQAWAIEWIETLCVLHEVPIDPRRRNEIAGAIRRLAAAPREGRSLTEFASELQTNDVREGVSFYTLSGPAGYILDGRTDTLTESRYQVFELEELMGMGEKVAIPVLLYLFRYIEKRFTGAPTLLTLDEVWVALTHELFCEKLKKWLRTLRSKNVAVILATQAISDVMNSPIRDVVVESCQTKILLPNPEARRNEASCEMYRKLGLNERQIDIIASSIKQQDYYYLSPLGQRLFSLGLGDVALAFVGATSEKDQALAKDFVNRYGEAWPAEWLRVRGLSEWADYWQRL
jgi:type IV secretion system protein VirB4